MRCWLPVALLVLASPAAAQVEPQPGEGDPRLQTVEFDANKVIRLSVASGVQMMVELAPGERIETIAVGDSTAWQISAGKRGDFFFVKNVSAETLTNMTIVSANRVYNFELAPSNGYGAIPAYHVRMLYPAKAQGRAIIGMEASFEYRLSGSKVIRPSSVVQEGSQTLLEWPESAPLPGIFMIENGSESLVNGEMQDGRFVIAGTPEKLIFRLDRLTAYATRKPLKGTSDE